ncbi:hypothetical protein PsorP6_008922 [Peronosclerospora sorghi]|uniref:Uncharacterized protein n=1 Tax=Peronosclerospora sorghi TaxID=230839 RepID=A0ACC0VXY5_9STRA|nr:hypothetical protein PsorP6_008922 [Peronosclerospora sorghi]
MTSWSPSSSCNSIRATTLSSLEPPLDVFLVNTKRLVAPNDKATIGEHTIISRSSSACGPI